MGTERIKVVRSRPQCADSEGGSPEEDANTKEIRNVEVNVLSMCGSTGTAASVLAIPPRRELELRRKHPAKAAMVWLSGGSGSGFAQLPVPGEELVQLGGRMIGNAAQYVGKPGLWIDAVEFCRSDEGVHRGSALTSPIGAC